MQQTQHRKAAGSFTPEKTVKLAASRVIFGASVVTQGFSSTRQDHEHLEIWLHQSACTTAKFSGIALTVIAQIVKNPRTPCLANYFLEGGVAYVDNWLLAVG